MTSLSPRLNECQNGGKINIPSVDGEHQYDNQGRGGDGVGWFVGLLHWSIPSINNVEPVTYNRNFYVSSNSYFHRLLTRCLPRITLDVFCERGAE